MGNIDWTQIMLALAVLLILWVVLGVVFRLARRVMSCGCSLIVAAGVLYVLLRWISST